MHQQGETQVLVPNLTFASPAMSSGSAKMALDPSDHQTDEDFYEVLVSRSPRWVSGSGGRGRGGVCADVTVGELGRIEWQINTQRQQIKMQRCLD